MWSAIFAGVGTIFKSWVGLKTAKLTAEAKYHENRAQAAEDWDVEAMRQAQYSWKDEFITAIWFSPLIVAWVYPEKARLWLDFVGDMPLWYQIIMCGIVAASFGLRWLWKNEGFKLTKELKNLNKSVSDFIDSVCLDEDE